MKKTGAGEHQMTVPDHREMAQGTLNDTLSAVSINAGVPKADLLERLRG